MDNDGNKQRKYIGVHLPRTYKTCNSENRTRDTLMKENEDDIHPTWNDR